MAHRGAGACCGDWVGMKYTKKCTGSSQRDGFTKSTRLQPESEHDTATWSPRAHSGGDSAHRPDKSKLIAHPLSRQQWKTSHASRLRQTFRKHACRLRQTRPPSHSWAEPQLGGNLQRVRGHQTLAACCHTLSRMSAQRPTRWCKHRCRERRSPLKS